LVVEWEELVGAKQNRIINATFLIANQTEITIPVSRKAGEVGLPFPEVCLRGKGHALLASESGSHEL